MLLIALTTFAQSTDLPVEESVATELGTGVTDLVPFIYGRRTAHGRVWKDLPSFLAGEGAVDVLERRHTYRFVSTVDTARGRVYMRPNGSVVPATELLVYTPSAFGGRDLEASPLQVGTTVAWAVGAQGARVRATAGGEILRTLAYHEPVELLDAPADTVWWPVVGGGYVHGSVLARWRPAPRPEGVTEDTLWIDVDVREQTLGVLRGDAVLYVTLVSTGVDGRATPVGTFVIYDKLLTNDMKSLAGADDPYHVEEVPWVIHFKPRYALHGAFWHDAFGHRVSHGCVNLAPRDARFVFERVAPLLPPGAASVKLEKGAPGTPVRVRE